MAVGKLRYNVLCLQVVLLRVAVLNWCVHRSLCSDLVPTLTIRPKSLLLSAINDTYEKSISISCSTSNQDSVKAQNIEEMTLWHQYYGRPSNDEIVRASALSKKASLSTNFAVARSRFKVTGAIAPTTTEPSHFTLSIRPGVASCSDSAWFQCKLKYTSVEGNEVETDDKALLDVAPTEVHVKKTPDETITIGMKLKLDCTGIIGTPAFAEPVKLLWVYTNRESALQNQYSALDDQMRSGMTEGDTEVVPCSEKQSVSLELTVDEIRDSMRDYYCVVSRLYAYGAEIVYVGRGDNKISMPDFSKPKEVVIGIGGYIGIGLALIAFIVTVSFMGVWCVRRQKKKRVRKQELNRRKSQIEERRKSIAEFVQQQGGVELPEKAEGAVGAEGSEGGEPGQSGESIPEIDQKASKTEDVSESEAPATEEGSAAHAEDASETEG